MTTTDRFAAVPRRFYDALKRREIKCDDFTLGCYLVFAADYRTHEFSETLRALADGVGWEKSDDSLRRSLARLRKGDWLDFSVRAGQRSPYVITLTGLNRASDTGLYEDEARYDDIPF